jgi:hypothetical protein
MKKLVALPILVSLLIAASSAARGPGMQNARLGASVSPTATAADTVTLAWYDFDGVGGQPDVQGWIGVDRTAQILTAFHVAGGVELNGGSFGNLFPLGGDQSIWCGIAPQGGAPFCGYATLPGYANGWHQILESNTVSGDSVLVSYRAHWDSEPGYDATTVEYSFDGGATWTPWPVGAGLSSAFGVYDGTGPPGGIVESFGALSPGAPVVSVRFRFQSSDSWSDADGLWDTDGAFLLDNITLRVYNGGALVLTNFEDFEGATPGDTQVGIWTGKAGPSIGNFADLYPGITLLQEDPCFFAFSHAWGFFDNPLNTNYACHTPDPRPGVGAMPFGTPDGVYMNNEIWSPVIPISGAGSEYRLTFDVYKDLPLDNLQFFTWKIRTWAAGCPSNWRDRGLVYYGEQRFWGTAFTEGSGITSRAPRFAESIGDLIEPTATGIQIAIGAVDMCGMWCGVFGTGTCHSHAPLIDNVHLERIDLDCPQWRVRHLDLFQDTFAADGTLTGTARADAAIDILPATSPSILPGDSVVVNVAPVGTDPNTSVGPSVYTYVAVWPLGQNKSGDDIEAPETRPGIGTRWPFVGTQQIDGINWSCYRMDTVVTRTTVAADRYCFDLSDIVFTPGDTICYFFGADDGVGNVCYWTRDVNGQGQDMVTLDIGAAAASPCEFTILPAGGYNRGGDVLYIDDTDDRGGPAQTFFDSAFDLLGIRGLVDRYDVLEPTSMAGNGPGSRVTDNIVQVVDVYRKILWNSGNLTNGLIGDGTGNPEKSDDFGLLFDFIDLGTDPGLYISGDDVAEEWVTLAGGGAVNLRATYMGFNLIDGSHINHGEPVSPMLTATGPCFTHAAVPDELVAFGGCPIPNNCDVLQPGGSAVIEFPFPNSGDGAVLSQATLNSGSSTARVILSGFSFHYIRDVGPTFPPARVEHLRDILIWLGNDVGEPTAIDPVPQLVTYLNDNYPNPFNPTTTIRYGIRERAHVSLKVYNVAGQLLRTLVDEVKPPAAEYRVKWNGDNDAGQPVASGVYFYKFVTKNFTQTKKMVLLK